MDELGNIVDGTTSVDPATMDVSGPPSMDVATGDPFQVAGIGSTILQQGGALIRSPTGQNLIQQGAQFGSNLIGGGGATIGQPGRVSVLIPGTRRKVNARGMMAMVRKFGADATAGALGLDVTTLMRLIVAGGGFRGRRRRGISARDLRTTKRVVSQVSRMSTMLSHLWHHRGTSSRGRSTSITAVRA